MTKKVIINEMTLNAKEFAQVKSVVLSGEQLKIARDLFLFQVYTSLSYGDLNAFDSTNIKEVDGEMVYVSSRVKTKEVFTVRLIPEVLYILTKYNYQLPYMSLSNYNSHLKVIAESAGIVKPLTSHVARITGIVM